MHPTSASSKTIEGGITATEAFFVAIVRGKTLSLRCHGSLDEDPNNKRLPDSPTLTWLFSLDFDRSVLGCCLDDLHRLHLSQTNRTPLGVTTSPNSATLTELGLPGPTTQKNLFQSVTDALDTILSMDDTAGERTARLSRETDIRSHAFAFYSRIRRGRSLWGSIPMHRWPSREIWLVCQK